ncbi:transposase [Lysinibacillus louembei]|uniref:transposase n=1 Tax=Lysinibacillus louembei TaxID=1470088 RepID=UPI0038732C2B
MLDMMNQVPVLKQPKYLLCDSWYTSRTIIEVALSKGIHVIGALKTNCMLYPQGIRTQTKQFATHIHRVHVQSNNRRDTT